ncbi:hypothetical protein [Streptomyces roseochromogenus]|uniref:Uncharacterized protein n=1 Tax=Streptomyces roseochromogenus subsp. oscitans DS 12.976 TaxID=1352936 RepID=V6K5W3_STRRC|nr:hypothetical protein [Streptomyces roseochromogenus]EST27443.1 hypothetical protein M878_25010 [Streptomyces roseochromogenus subsp. oscitans DS 12.976]
MSTLTIAAPARPAGASAQDHGIALLTARAGLEPDLAARYLTDPVSVLAEFGVAATEPVYLVEAGHETLVIEDLDSMDTSVTLGSYFTPQYLGEHSGPRCA